MRNTAIKSYAINPEWELLKQAYELKEQYQNITLMPDAHIGKDICVGFTVKIKNTLDESPNSYKNADDIINSISDTVTIVKRLKLVYNFKGN